MIVFSARNPTPEIAQDDVVYVNTEAFYTESMRDINVPFRISTLKREGRAISNFDTLILYEVYFDGRRHFYMGAGTQEVTIITNAGSKTVEVPYFLTALHEDPGDGAVISGIVNGVHVHEVVGGREIWGGVTGAVLQAAEEGDEDLSLTESGR